MKNIRQGVFETNSSSSHSISIAEDSDGIFDTLPVKNGVVSLNGGEFGWEEAMYFDAETKANYCAVDCRANPNPDMVAMLIKVICDHTGAKEVKFNFATEYWKVSDEESNSNLRAYIDHQSSGTSFEAFASEETLKMFIFNPNSFLQTDNDNH